jgi:hypothetical protein
MGYAGTPTSLSLLSSADVQVQPIVDYVGDYVRQHFPYLEDRKPAIFETCMYVVVCYMYCGYVVMYDILTVVLY